VLCKLFCKVEKLGKLIFSFCEASTIVIAKPDKDKAKPKNCRLIPLLNMDTKIHNKIPKTKLKNTSKRSYTTIKLHSFQGCKDGSTSANQ
jgi:hypothetical protein